jgi:hypothetical protein
MSTLPAVSSTVAGPMERKAQPPALLNLSAALYAIRWLVRDTFRQSFASGIFPLMLCVSLLCTLLCLSIGVEGGTKLNHTDGPAEFLPRNDPRAQDPAKAAEHGVDVVGGDLTLAFGAIRIPLGRDAEDSVRFVQALLGLGVADATGLLLVLIWTAGFLPTFLEPSSAAVMLAKPVPRWSLLAGKYLGVLAFVAVQALVFVGGTWLALGVKTGVWDPSYFLCVPMLLIHFAIFYSFSVLLAVATRSTVACVFGSILFWMLCWGMNYGRHAAVALTDLHGATGHFSWAVEVGYWVLPKPADMSIMLIDSLQAGKFFGSVLEYQRVQEMGAYQPGLSLLTSLLFAAAVLGLSAWEFVHTDY